MLHLHGSLHLNVPPSLVLHQQCNGLLHLGVKAVVLLKVLLTQVDTHMHTQTRTHIRAHTHMHAVVLLKVLSTQVDTHMHT